MKYLYVISSTTEKHSLLSYLDSAWDPEAQNCMPYAVGEYYENAAEYDLEYQSQSEQDVPFWRELVMRYLPQQALELACGSGRIGLELLRGPGDFQLEGLDISEEMLA